MVAMVIRDPALPGPDDIDDAWYSWFVAKCDEGKRVGQEEKGVDTNFYRRHFGPYHSSNSQ